MREVDMWDTKWIWPH